MTTIYASADTLDQQHIKTDAGPGTVQQVHDFGGTLKAVVRLHDGGLIQVSCNTGDPFDLAPPPVYSHVIRISPKDVHGAARRGTFVIDHESVDKALDEALNRYYGHYGLTRNDVMAEVLGSTLVR